LIKCPKCGSEVFESLEPKVANLVNEYDQLPKQERCWRCSNPKCDFRKIVEY